MIPASNESSVNNADYRQLKKYCDNLEQKLNFDGNEYENLRKLKDIIDIAIEGYIDTRDRDDFLDMIIEYCANKQSGNIDKAFMETINNTSDVIKRLAKK